MRHLLAIAALLTAPALAEVHLVDYYGTAGVSTIQEAVDAAENGDMILVARAANINTPDPGFVIDNKSLTIVGLEEVTSGTGLQCRSVAVRNLGKNKTVVIKNMRLGPYGTSAPASALDVTNSPGAVRVEGCTMVGQGPWTFNVGGCIDLNLALDVSLVDCEVWGSTAGAIHASQSRIVVYRSMIQGLAGRPDASYETAVAGDGFDGLVLVNRSYAWLGLSQVKGGTGGTAECIHQSNCTALAGDGGNGAYIETGSLCVRLESDVLPGDAGIVDFGGDGSMEGDPGMDYVGSIQTVPGAHRDLDAPLTIASGETAHLVLRGQPGENVTLLVGDRGGHRYLGWQWGVLLVNGGFAGGPIDLGTVPASGVLEVDVPLPAALPTEAKLWAMQAVFRTSATRYRLSPLRVVSVMGDATPFLRRPERIYMNPSAPDGGHGRTWEYASNNLRDTLVFLPEERETTGSIDIWMAKGTYTPAPRSDPMSRASISTRDGFRCLGGFSGSETSADQRDPIANPVIISGDLAGDDRDPMGSADDNSSGLIHTATYLTNRPVTFSGISFYGYVGAPAIEVLGGITHIDRCTFRSEAAGYERTGLRARRGALPGVLNVESCRFLGDGDDESTGIEVCIYSDTCAFDVSVHGCEFLGHTTNDSTQQSPVGFAAVGCAITAWANGANLDLRNCSFVDNDAETSTGLPGPLGGIYVRDGVNVTMINCLIASERQSTGLETPYTAINPAAGDVAEFNCVNWLGPGWDPATNFVATPAFADVFGADGLRGTGDEDLRPAPGSPAIDAGDSFAVPAALTQDLGGGARVVDDPNAPDVGQGSGAIVDVGAYERQAP